MLAVAGSVVGCVAAVAYAALLVQFLGAFWPGGALQSFLRPHYTVVSFLVGGAASLAVSVLTILWSAFSLGRVAPSALLAGQTTAEGGETIRKRPKWSLSIAIVALIGAVGLSVAGWSVPGAENQAMTFFGAGALLLTACLAAAAAWMTGVRHGLVEGGGWWGVARLGVRNAARHRVRSLLTAGMLASAAFLIVSVEAFRQEAAPDSHNIHGPDGGFSLVADSDLPIVQDLNSDKGRGEIADRLQVQLQHKYHGQELRRPSGRGGQSCLSLRHSIHSAFAPATTSAVSISTSRAGRACWRAGGADPARPLSVRFHRRPDRGGDAPTPGPFCCGRTAPYRRSASRTAWFTC